MRGICGAEAAGSDLDDLEDFGVFSSRGGFGAALERRRMRVRLIGPFPGNMRRESGERYRISQFTFSVNIRINTIEAAVTKMTVAAATPSERSTIPNQQPMNAASP